MAKLKNTIINDTGFLKIPAGNTSDRPTQNLLEGIFRFNTQTFATEEFSGGNFQNTLQEYIPKAEEKNIFGLGSEGIQEISGEINSYTYMTTSFVGPSDNSASFDSTSEFSSGDLVLIHQTQDGVDLNESGKFEEKRISDINGNTITFSENFTQSYNANQGANTNSSRQVQLVKIREFESCTLTNTISAKSWNGRSGGIIALKCSDTLDFNGNTITASERGFRGGEYGPGNNDGGFAGEGRYGTDTTRHSSSTNTGEDNTGGGGEAGPAASLGGCGAAGGTYGTQGGVGTRNTGSAIAQPASVYGREDLLNSLHFGGGGGGGGDNDNQGGPVAGGEGGGIIYIAARKVLNADIRCDGRTHVISPDQGGCGPAVNGSGAGGSIWMKAESVFIDNCTANGGNTVRNNNDCANDGEFHPNGGAGGNGRIRIDGATSGVSSPNFYNGSIYGGLNL